MVSPNAFYTRGLIILRQEKKVLQTLWSVFENNMQHVGIATCHVTLVRAVCVICCKPQLSTCHFDTVRATFVLTN